MIKKPVCCDTAVISKVTLVLSSLTFEFMMKYPLTASVESSQLLINEETFVPSFVRLSIAICVIDPIEELLNLYFCWMDLKYF